MLKMRLRDIGEARIPPDEPESGTKLPAPSPRWRSWVPWGIATAAVLGAAALGIAWMRSGTGDAGPGKMRFAIPMPGPWPLFNNATEWVPAPDGRNLALVAMDGGEKSRAFWVRPLNAAAAHRLDNTEGANFPFRSPDGRRLRFSRTTS